MRLPEPYNSWLIKTVGENIDASTRFVVNVTAVTSNGNVEIPVDFDLVWFILLNSKDGEKIKLDLVLEILKDPAYLAQFKATFQIYKAKRMLAEFLLFNPVIMQGLKQYIDFSLLDVPLDFISHTLFIQYGEDVNSVFSEADRFKTVVMVLDSGFKLNKEIPAKSLGLAVHKLLLLEVGVQKYAVARRLLKLGFQLFSDVSTNNNEVAVLLLTDRDNSDAKTLISENKDRFKTLVFKVGDNNNSNIADYFYWVREDMAAVDFIRKTLNIEISP